MTLEASLFELGGLGDMITDYHLYALRGIGDETTPNFHKSVNILVRGLSFRFKAPFMSLSHRGSTVIAAPSAVDDLPLHHPSTAGMVTLQKLDETLALNFVGPPDHLDPLRLRYLDFVIQQPLFRNDALWQPRAGRPFYEKKSSVRCGPLDLFQGFSVRATRHPEGNFGLVIDARSKLISASPIGPLVDDKSAGDIEGRRCLYKMGDTWYEFKIFRRSDMKVGEVSILDGKEPINLIQFLTRQAGNAAPKALANLNPDGSALEYFRNDGTEKRSAPAELCYLVEDTQSRDGARYQRQTILTPGDRRSRIVEFVTAHLETLAVGNIAFSVPPVTHAHEGDVFPPPDLEFGNGVTLQGMKQTGQSVDLVQYSKRRRKLMLDPKAGFFDHGPLDPQSVIMPKSVLATWGPAYVDDLKEVMARIYPDGHYDPIILSFNDFDAGRSLPSQMNALLELAKSGAIATGDALIMVHPVKGPARVQDRLAAMVVNEFYRQFDIRAHIVHSNTPNRGYQRIGRNEKARYVKQKKKGLNIDGYLKGTALNKICLSNNRWPFVLKTSLNADLVIGIDVKNNMAAFTLIGDGGRIIRTFRDRSNQKEQLLPTQVAQAVTEMVRKEMPHFSAAPSSVAVHRDGRVWPGEIDGLKSAFTALAGEGTIPGGYDLSVFEILKSSPAPLRLFGFDRPNRANPTGVDNPPMGAHIQTSATDGYVCTTGAPLLRNGTADPLHIRRAFGEMAIDTALQDVFSLSCLTWPKPDGCMRLPLSIKLCDMALFDDAADYDMDEARFFTDDMSEMVD